MKSSPDRQLLISRAAYDDLVDIQNYTFARYGKAQWQAYSELLDAAFKHIARQPSSGRHRDDLPENYLAWHAGKHVIIYRTEEDIVYVIRVLHQRMDFTFRFQ